MTIASELIKVSTFFEYLRNKQKIIAYFKTQICHCERSEAIH